MPGFEDGGVEAITSLGCWPPLLLVKQLPAGMAGQKSFYHLAILLGMHGAGGIDQTPGWLQQGRQAFEQPLLLIGQFGDAVGLDSPAGIGMAGQRSQPRARGIHQNAIKVTAPLGPYFEQVGGVGRKHLHAHHA